jgi:nucleoside phosphorylase
VFQDIDATPLQEYGHTPFEVASKQIVLNTDSNITCFTTDYFYDAKQRDKYSKNYLKMVDECSVFDMECFALAKVCKRFNMKFTSYKWVSDDGDANNWKEMCHIGFEKVKDILK